VVDRKRERELIEAAQRGDTRAFAALYRAYVDKIYRYILYRVDTAETAEDLTSDVFVRVLEGLPGYQYRAVPLLVWLYRIAHDRVIDHYRRSKRSQRDEPIDDLELSSDDDDLDAPLLAQYNTQHILGAIRSLTDTQRQVIIFRFVEGYNLENTARLLGKTVDAVKAMQYRALQALGKALNEQGYRRPGDRQDSHAERLIRRR
jgi:RNA polymerase sigma-70 factor (ECF subfamily)